MMTLAGAVCIFAVASWIEARVHSRLRGASLRRRIAWRVALPLLPLVFIPGPIWAIDMLLASNGYDGALLLIVTIAGVWFASAALGSALIVALDASVNALLATFRGRVRALVLSLLVLSCSASVWLAPRLFAVLGAGDESLSSWWRGGIWPRVGARFATAPGLGALVHGSSPGLLFVAAVTVLIGLPSVLSATSKFAGLVMERIYPLAAAFDVVATGARGVRVEEGGSQEFLHLARRFNHMVATLAMAERMERAFGTYVSTHVLAQIRAQHGEAHVAGSLREASVFFADIRGFTQMSEQLAPQAIVEVLNLFFARAVEVIDAHEGYLNKFVGDALIVVFNGPIDQADHAERATRCAIALQTAVATLNAAHAFVHVESIQIGVGVATGPMVCGSVGSSRQMEYTVIGDVVNIAARLCSLAAGGAVWITQQTANQLPADLPARPLEPAFVKGKKDPVPVAVVWPPP